ncbi:DNA-binding transcriptional repressor DeoR [Caviibacterium pharyngocola]|uniref:DNA-binding transcriptional repressor DeoR n=1 Tax=Caviibacterium pharyngocola TaxID=28159 RepID=A0A2M8RWI4_9PAST|nr:DNA-binding transcriptional repressor DeoR [Caviibacterium pharyngocola]PJG83234.1 DNA-binding transcriptional repressor DeoR [Caviibacterium pharyngocola]
MDKKINSRIQKLAFLLNQMDKIHLRDAAEILNVSEMTIRRDLNGDTDSVVLLGGYIVKNPQQNTDKRYFVAEQQTKHIAEKMHIGSLASELVQEGDVVFFDCGSTVPFIASQINSSIKFTALCCSLNTFMVLQDKPNCEVILCGGSYSRNNSFFSPLHLSSELDAVCTTKAFISAAGVDIKQGVTCFNFNEAKIKAKAMVKSRQNILVFDHSKLNQVQQAYIGELTQFDMIISNNTLPPQFECGGVEVRW